jgi:hypothetical protein
VSLRTHAAKALALWGLLPLQAFAQASPSPVLTVEAGVAGTFDNNAGRNAAALDSYGGAGELLLRLASRPAAPLFQLEYSALLRRSSGINPTDGMAHRVSGLVTVPLADWLRLNLIARAGRGGADEDLTVADEMLVIGRLNVQASPSTRIRAYGAHRWIEPPPGQRPTVGAYTGVELRQRVDGRTMLLLDARYEELAPPDTTRVWQRGSLAASVGRRITRSTALEAGLRRRMRLHPQRTVEFDGAAAPRRDVDTRLTLSLVYDNGRGAELRAELEHDARVSNDTRRSYDAGRINIGMRHRVFGFGGPRPPPRIDERAATDALEAARQAAATMILEAGRSFTSVAVGGASVCALVEDGAAVCWSGSGALSAAAVTGSWSRVAVGVGRACGLDPMGAAYCWTLPATLDNGTSDRTEPRPVPTSLRFMDIAVGGEHACALTADGAAWCWGSNSDGQLGTGSALPTTAPARVAGRAVFRAITAGGRHTCALATDDTAWCWGANESSQSAAGPLRRALVPNAVAGIRLTQLSAGTRHNCGLDRELRVWCWGDNSGGQGGQPGGSHLPAPATVAAPSNFMAVAAGWAHTCALDVSGRAWCWGRNRRGELGNGRRDDESHPIPSAVAGDRSFTSLAISARSCAFDEAHTLYCWGSGFSAGHDVTEPVPLSTARASSVRR